MLVFFSISSGLEYSYSLYECLINMFGYFRLPELHWFFGSADYRHSLWLVDRPNQKRQPLSFEREKVKNWNISVFYVLTFCWEAQMHSAENHLPLLLRSSCVKCSLWKNGTPKSALIKPGDSMKRVGAAASLFYTWKTCFSPYTVALSVTCNLLNTVKTKGSATPSW